MKILKYTLILIGVLIVGFLLMGVVKPQVSYDCEISVDKPVQESWAVIQDEEKLSDWLTGFKRIEHVSGTPGTEGAVADVYFDNNGQEMAIRETITSLVPDESISMSYTSDFMNMDYNLSMEDVEGGTKINTNTVAKGNGMFARSMMALMAGSIKAQETMNLENLKQTIEKNEKNYFPVDTMVVDSLSNIVN